jgi:hypothetical protein
MWNLGRCFCALLLSTSICLGNAALAETVSFTPEAVGTSTGNFVGQIPIASIGNLKLPQGLAVFDGHTIEIDAVPDWLFDRDAVLTGAVIHASMTASGANAIIKGLVFFNAGSWIRNLAAPLARDTIRTTSGGTVAGTVQAIMPDGLEILQLSGGRRKVLFSEIESITSPRAFNFAASADSLKIDPASRSFQGQSLQIAFVPMAMAGRLAMHRPSVPASHLPGTEGGVPNSVIATEVLIDVAVNVVAPAVAIPMVFGVNRNAETIAKVRAVQAETGTFGPINP